MINFQKRKLLYIRKKLLNRFLKENNCYDMFYYLFKKEMYKNIGCKYKTINDLILDAFDNANSGYNEILLAFIWKDSINGRNYWRNIYMKWDKIINYEQHR